jgi:hypothetical protein
MWMDTIFPMSRSIHINNPADWERLRPGDFVVFLIDAYTEVVCASDGKASSGDETIPVFDSLEAARVHAEAAVESMLRLCAQAFDHRDWDYRGRAGDPVEQVYHKSLRRRFDRRRQAKNECLAGGAMLGCFGVWVIWGAASDWRFLWFYLIGLKLFIVGSLLTVRGVGWMLGQKKRAL